MSTKYLGTTPDIHGGGVDLQFPHHENELAQSESYTGVIPFAKYWMHNGLMKMGHAKMAGSVGNVINVADRLRPHHPATGRYLLLSAHYRSPIEWSDERLAEIRRALDGFYRFFERYQRITGESFYSIDPPKSEKESMEVQQQYQEVQGDSMHRITNNAHFLFKECMNDDFNTGGAVGRVK